MRWESRPLFCDPKHRFCQETRKVLLQRNFCFSTEHVFHLLQKIACFSAEDVLLPSSFLLRLAWKPWAIRGGDAVPFGYKAGCKGGEWGRKRIHSVDFVGRKGMDWVEKVQRRVGRRAGEERKGVAVGIELLIFACLKIL